MIAMWDKDAGTEYTCATLQELAQSPRGDRARAVLSDPNALADYDTRARHGLPMELYVAWGIAAFCAGDEDAARRHWTAAARLAPDDRAVPRLLEFPASGAAPRALPASARRDARAEMPRVRNNSAFPHRLVRFAAAAAAEPEDITPAALDGARELQERDVLEAPRSYAMVLPVLRGHYPAVYDLARPFFDATVSVLADHGPRADYEREKSRRARAPRKEASREPDPPVLQEPTAPPRVLPPLRIEDHRWVWPQWRLRVRLPSTGYAWIGAVLGAAFFFKDGPVPACCAAVVGFLLAYAVNVIARRP
jgi:hypothetical protein